MKRLIIGALLCAVLLQSCTVIALHAMNLGEHSKDVSSDLRYASIIGKKFELIKENYLYRSPDTNKWYLSNRLLLSAQSGEISEKFHADVHTLSHGTVIEVAQVYVMSTYLGGDRSTPYIQGHVFLSDGYITADLTSLFERTSSYEELRPKEQLIMPFTKDE